MVNPLPAINKATAQDGGGGNEVNIKTDNERLTNVKTDNESLTMVASQKPKAEPKTGYCAYVECGKPFVKTVAHKKYCCEEHKIKQWELSNNTKFVKGLKKSLG